MVHPISQTKVADTQETDSKPVVGASRPFTPAPLKNSSSAHFTRGLAVKSNKVVPKPQPEATDASISIPDENRITCSVEVYSEKAKKRPGTAKMESTKLMPIQPAPKRPQSRPGQVPPRPMSTQPQGTQTLGQNSKVQPHRPLAAIPSRQAKGKPKHTKSQAGEAKGPKGQAVSQQDQVKPASGVGTVDSGKADSSAGQTGGGMSKVSSLGQLETGAQQSAGSDSEQSGLKQGAYSVVPPILTTMAPPPTGLDNPAFSASSHSLADSPKKMSRREDSSDTLL